MYVSKPAYLHTTMTPGLHQKQHPNIVKYHGFVKSSDSLYIILE